MGNLFGTDGVRGVAGRDLDARLATRVAAAAATVLTGYGRPGAGRPVAVVGRDPRASGQFLEAAVVAGLAGHGVDVRLLGVLPTPALAYLTDATGADFGVMLSASHNPAPDNGIKFFARGGLKLPDQVEDEIEAVLAAQDSTGHVPAAGFGRVVQAAHESERYIGHVLSSVGEAPLQGMRVVVDCAHGAAYQLAPRLLTEAGAQVTAIGVEPDGDNINADCGSTSLGALREAVIADGADAGIAFDGDADRCLAVDAAGEVVDGDHILAVLALDLKKSGRLAGNTVVATVMANLGFRLAMAQAGIDVVETPVGDRYLLAAMLDGKYVLGGEQSGHVIMLDHATTGDGLLTSVHLLATVARSGRTLADLARAVTKYPQVLVNVHVPDKSLVAAAPSLAAAVDAARSELGDRGRVLVRPSGTERAVRVMVEAIDARQARQIADGLADVVRGLGY